MHPEVLDAMLPWLGLAEAGSFANPASLHSEGKLARQALDAARAVIAQAIGATPPEIVFTSGGTESNNALIAGIAQGVRARYGPVKGGNLVVTSAFEHHAVLEPIRALRRNGWQTVELKPSRAGLIEPAALLVALEQAAAAGGTGSGGAAGGGAADAARTSGAATGGAAVARDGSGTTTAAAAQTVSAAAAAAAGGASTPTPTSDFHCTLVSIMTVNNEIGTIQPIDELAAISRQHGALFHTDAVQALGKIPFNVNALGIDAASFSAHKIAGPKGVGAFYLRTLTPFNAQMLGGGQERDLRSGTVNVAGAVGFAKAVELALLQLEAERTRLAGLRELLVKELAALSPQVHLTIDAEERGFIPNIISILIDGFESEELIMRLDSAGFAVSGGAACSSASLEPSHVLLSMGLSRRQAQSVLRISLGSNTQAGDIDGFMQEFRQVVN